MVSYPAISFFRSGRSVTMPGAVKAGGKAYTSAVFGSGRRIRFLLRHHAESLVQICNNLTVAVDKVAVASADGILIGLLTATQFIDFFLIHWFCQTFRYDRCRETP